MQISFREVFPEDAQMILDWRTSRRVTNFMNTDMEYDIEAQMRWLKACGTKPHYYHWIIECDKKSAGLASISDYDPAKKTTSWGFYIGNDEFKGAGGLVPPFLYNYCFRTLGVERIEAEVFFNNVGVIKLHQMHGYFFTPAGDRVIEKNGKEILLISMKLERATFLDSRFARYQVSFPTLNWIAAPAESGIVSNS